MANNALYTRLSVLFNADYNNFVVVFHGGDDVTTPYFGNTDYILFDTYVSDAANNHSKRGWEDAYEVINIANGIILNYRNAEGTVNEETLRYFAGQAHFARAYMYYWLVRVYNAIPYVTTAREGDRTIQPSQPGEVYGYIVDDLQLAEEWLPTTWKGIDETMADGGAFTRGTAKATLASVYLTMAGYPLKQTEYYRLAKEKAAEIIEQESTYGYRLLAHCAELWKVTPKVHDEMVFFIPYDRSADHNVRAPKECRPVQFGGWEAYCPEINFFHRFEAGERKDATFVTEFPLTSGFYTTKPTWPWPDTVPMLSWEQMMFKHPYYFKMWEAEDLEGENKWKPADGDNDWYSSRTNLMIRYAEVLLIYAEAQAMADGAPNALAYECVNRVRNRAFAGVGTQLNDLKPGLSGEAFRDSVFVERGWEFAGELAIRWFDLVRLELVEDAVRAKPQHSFLPGRSSAEWEIPQTLPTHDSYFLPIPEEDALLNPNLNR